MKKILSDLIDEAIYDGYTDFYSGMALGFDIFAAEAVLEKIKDGIPIRLHAAIPCPKQNLKWSIYEKKRYNSILDKCSTRIVISPSYTNSCMLTRDRFMVEKSLRVISAWNGDFRGGTGYTLRYAKSLKREIHIIHIPDMTVSVI